MNSSASPTRRKATAQISTGDILRANVAQGRYRAAATIHCRNFDLGEYATRKRPGRPDAIVPGHPEKSEHLVLHPLEPPREQRPRDNPDRQRAWQNHRARSWQSDHRTWQARGGYSGYALAGRRFNVNSPKQLAEGR